MNITKLAYGLWRPLKKNHYYCFPIPYFREAAVEITCLSTSLETSREKSRCFIKTRLHFFVTSDCFHFRSCQGGEHATHYICSSGDSWIHPLPGWSWATRFSGQMEQRWTPFAHWKGMHGLLIFFFRNVICGVAFFSPPSSRKLKISCKRIPLPFHLHSYLAS